MIRYFDSANDRLVYVNTAATSNYWDEHWESDDFEKLVKVSNNPFIVNNTKKYLEKGSKILEGGCGRGDKVYALKANGFDAFGIDYAEETVQKINKAAPELDVTLDDVRQLKFDDNSFDGYWSLGVIEHFYDGYDSIALEMKRVIRPNGFLFMTVPSMSPLRKLKSFFSLYPVYKESKETKNGFYQFALSPKSVIDHFTNLGFELIEHKPYDGFKGLKDEAGPLKPLLQWCYDSNNIFCKVIRKAINLTMTNFSNHMSFYIMKNNKGL